MTDVPAREPEPTPPTAAPRRKGPPAWGIVTFLVLLGGLVIVNQLASTSGRPVDWIENDLPAALKKAAQVHRKVFLYLYEANDPVHARNKDEVFEQRWAKKPLENVVCCRVDLKSDELLRFKYKYADTPLFLLLDENGKELTRTDGPTVDARQFRTYIGDPASRKH